VIKERSALTLGQLLVSDFSAKHLIDAGMTPKEAAAKGDCFASASRFLIDTGRDVNTPATAVFIPGRIEIFGKHTDYCGGRSLLCTVERGMCIVAVPNVRPQINFHALDLDQSAEWPIDADLEPVAGHWSNYPMTVVRRISQNFPHTNIGADIALSSDLPAASGLSSSSAMIIGTFLVLSKINQLQKELIYRENIRSLEDLAAYAACIENGQSYGELQGDRGVGTFGGSQDHTAILCCRPGKLSVYSFCPVKHERDVDFPSDFQFFIADSHVIAEKTGDALTKYNRVSQRASTIVELWNNGRNKRARCLRDIASSDPSEIQKFCTLLVQYDAGHPSAHLLARFQQFQIESEELIPKAVNAMASADWKTFKQLVSQSQQLAEKNLENQVPETTALCKNLIQSGAVAASAFGAGFGGSVWGLFRNELNVDIAAKGFTTRPGCSAITITA
jgi:galactokinase